MARPTRMLVAATGAGALLVAALRRFEPVRVTGPSMQPTLQPGDLLITRPLRAGEPTVGQIVVARTPARAIVKRVGIPPRRLDPGEVWLEGDHPARSTDSRGTGPVARADITGVVVARYWPLLRAGRVRSVSSSRSPGPGYPPRGARDPYPGARA